MQNLLKKTKEKAAEVAKKAYKSSLQGLKNTGGPAELLQTVKKRTNWIGIKYNVKKAAKKAYGGLKKLPGKFKKKS